MMAASDTDYLLHVSAGALRAHAGPDDGVLVAYSGGLDSTVLLHLLHRLSRRQGFDIAALHVDHGLRPDSGDDARFCLQHATHLGIPAHVERIDVRRTASTQAQARAQRYAVIEDVCQRLGLGVVATAHHADDALETALFNLARGAGLGGLTALAASRQLHATGPTLVRPLLNVPRAVLERYAAAHALTWRLDPTNAKLDYERNRLRHQVVPALVEERGIEPIITSLLNLRSEASALEGYARALMEAARVPEAGLHTQAFDRARLADAPPATVAQMLRLVSRGWTFATLAALRDALDRTPDNNQVTRISIPGAVVTVRADRIVIEPTTEQGSRELDAQVAIAARVDVSTNGALPWFDRELRWVRRPPREGDLGPSAPDVARFDAQSMPSTLALRGPHPGERMPVGGMRGRKRIADIFNEHGVPADLRWRWPCLALPGTGGQILWLGGLRRAPRHPADVGAVANTITEATMEVVEFELTGRDQEG